MHKFPSPDRVYLAQVEELIEGTAEGSDLVISLRRTDERPGGVSHAVYLGERGTSYSVSWTGPRELTVRVPGMIGSTHAYEEVTVILAELKKDSQPSAAENSESAR
jgi:hypothetical protein